MIPAYNKMRCAAFPFETGIHFRRKTDFFPEEDTTKSYSGFELEPTWLQAEGHSHHTGWATLDLLKGRFENKNMLINAHLSNLLNLTLVRNPTDIVSLRNLYNKAETQIRSLESLGVKGESYSNLLTPILLKQIPSELVLEFNRSQKDEGFDLSALLQFLHLEIRSRELVE
ncbi:uncharacterized protein TNCV_3408281 [Trichonephila clavipes]|nr:uncharacterized protein TNCV_3408281 [Trichonephila clavipes]